MTAFDERIKGYHRARSRILLGIVSFALLSPALVPVTATSAAAQPGKIDLTLSPSGSYKSRPAANNLSMSLTGVHAGLGVPSSAPISGQAQMKSLARFTGFTAPTMPRSFRVTRTTTGATARWKPPKSNGRAPITSVTVDDGHGHGCVVRSRTTSSCKIGHLSPGQAYVFSATARNKVGSSPRSNRSWVTPLESRGAVSSPTALGRAITNSTILHFGAITITGFHGSINPVSGTFSGTAIATLSSVTFDVKVTFKDQKNWSVAADSSSVTGSWRIAPGFVVQASGLGGAMAMVDGKRTSSRLSVTFTNLSVGGVLQLTNGVVSISDQCPAPLSEIACGDGSGDFFAVSGSLALHAKGLATGSVPFKAAYSFATTSFAGSFPKGLTLKAASARVNGFSWSPDKSSVVVDGNEIPVAGGAFVLTGTASIPNQVTDFLGGESPTSLGVVATFASPSEFSVTGVISGAYPLPVKADIEIDSIAATFGSTVEDGPFVKLSAQAQVVIPIAVGTSPPIDAAVSITGHLKGKFEISISAAPHGSAVNIWEDAMNIPGLNLTHLGVQVGFTIPGPLPDVGFTAAGTLPLNLLSALGVSGTPPIAMTLNASKTNPCFAVALGTPGSDAPPIINLGNGAITASDAEFSTAPRGACTVADVTIPSGVHEKFEGSFLGVHAAFSADEEFDPVKLKYSTAANLKVDAFTVGSFSMDQTEVGYSASSEGQVTLTLKGGLKLPGLIDEVHVDGGLTFEDGVVSYQLTGDAYVNVAGNSLKIAVDACANYANVCEGSTEVTGSADLATDFAGGFVGGAGHVSGTFTPTDISMSWDSNLAVTGFELSSMHFTLVLGDGVASLTGDATVNVGLVAGHIHGSLGAAGDNTPAYTFSMAAGLAIPGLPAGTSTHGQLSLTNCTDPVCSTTTSTPQGNLSGEVNFLNAASEHFDVTVAGYTFDYAGIIGALKLHIADFVVAMEQAGYSVRDTALTTRDFFTVSVTQVGEAMKAAGYSAADVLRGIEAAGQYLDPVAIGHIMKDSLSYSADQAAAAFEQTGATIEATAEVLQAAYHETLDQTAALLTSAGYASSAVSSWFTDTGNRIAKCLTDPLNCFGGSQT